MMASPVREFNIVRRIMGVSSVTWMAIKLKLCIGTSARHRSRLLNEVDSAVSDIQ